MNVWNSENVFILEALEILFLCFSGKYIAYFFFFFGVTGQDRYWEFMKTEVREDLEALRIEFITRTTEIKKCCGTFEPQ